MKKPFLLKTLSYFKDVLLESTSSEYNATLEVYLSNGRYQLCTAGAIYSYEDKYVNFYKTFSKIDWSKINIEKVLILGLGLGSIPQMLENNFDKFFEYHIVEIDSEIIRLAEKYILSDLKSPTQIYEMDAEIYIEITDEKFDMIIIDIFDNNVIPPKFENEEFLEKTHEMLNENGLLLFNRLNTNEKTFEKSMSYHDDIFKKVFPISKKIFIQNNVILCSRNDIF